MMWQKDSNTKQKEQVKKKGGGGIFSLYALARAENKTDCTNSRENDGKNSNETEIEHKLELREG